MNPYAAAIVWRSLIQAEHLTAQQEDDLDEAECVILSRQPETLDDMVDQLAVLAAQGGDRRSDGLDVEALERLLAFAEMLRRSSSVSAETARGA